MRKVKMFLKRRDLYINGMKYKVQIKIVADTLGLKIEYPLGIWLCDIFEKGLIPEIALQKQRGVSATVWNQLCKEVYSTYENRCMACGTTEKLSVDHIKPISFYPELGEVFSNLQILCRSCNSKKGNRTIVDYRSAFLA